jgi:hypothetical protein
MSRIAGLISTLLAITFPGFCFAEGDETATHANPRSRALMHSVRTADVRWTDGFWAERWKLCRREMLPSVERALLDPANSEQLVNLKIAAGLAEGEYRGTDWSDGDCYKWLEAMALFYAVTQDPELERKLDEWIGIIAAAQSPDGYLSTNMTLRQRPPYALPPPKRYGGTFHEMYNMGHLLTAACTHYQATGKDHFLNVARKMGDHLHRVFQPGAPELAVTSGNLPVLMGLVDLYRTTGQRRYLDTARVIVDARGATPGGSDLTQDHVPFRQETEAVGHAVFATYLYCGATDLYAETGEQALWDPLQRIWTSAALRRTYITGGACAIPNGKSARGDDVHEAFGADYQLPNRTAYNETCANVGNAMWNLRMLELTGDARHADIIETVLHNSLLSAVSADGQRFCYANPLAWTGEAEGPTKHHTGTRWSVHSCYCCPPQVARTIAGLGRWAYSVSHDGVWVHLYGGNRLQTRLPGGEAVQLTQATGYPWQGRVLLTVNATPAKELTLRLRIPAWAQSASLHVNGQPWTGEVKPGGYASVRRQWSAGDRLELDLPLAVRLMEADPRVDDCRNRVAVQRGPVVYCLELPKEQGGGQVWDKGVFLPENVPLTPRFEGDFLGGVTILSGQALTQAGRDRFVQDNASAPLPAPGEWNDRLYRPLAPRGLRPPANGTVDITLIPYFAWANRGLSMMEVWIPLAR